jgi:hypothetical protein
MRTHVPLHNERSWYDSYQHGWCVRLTVRTPRSAPLCMDPSSQVDAMFTLTFVFTNTHGPRYAGFTICSGSFAPVSSPPPAPPTYYNPPTSTPNGGSGALGSPSSSSGDMPAGAVTGIAFGVLLLTVICVAGASSSYKRTFNKDGMKVRRTSTLTASMSMSASVR